MTKPCRSAFRAFLVVWLILLFCDPGLADDRTIKRNKTGDPGAANEQRIALVIGNGDYESSPLKNPVNDAEAMAGTLAQVGFTVIKKTNLDQKGMKKAIDDFGRRLGPESVALFFFAGHGMQVKGHNYLIPVNTRIESEEDVEYEAVRADRVLAKMDQAKPKVNIVILDACRNNPFARSFRSGSQGLAHMDAPSGTIIAYATAPGSIASDGTGQNGLYTQELVKFMASPGLAIEEVFKQVRVGVQELSGKKQIPWESSSLVGNFYFAGGSPGQQMAVNAPPPSAMGSQVTGRPLYGRVKVVSNVDGAAFNLAGQQYTTRAGSEITIDQVPAGPHTVTVRQEGYADWQSVIVVQNNGTAILDIQMAAIASHQGPVTPPSANMGPAAVRSFTDPVMKFGINVPSNWAVNNFNEEGDRVLAMMSPDQNVSFRIRAFPLGPGATIDQMRVVFETLLQNKILNNTGQTIEMDESAVNGLPGMTALYKGFYNNIPVSLVAFYAIKNQTGYILWTMIPTQMYEARIQEVLTLAESFTPGR